jgi:hypothetical protein
MSERCVDTVRIFPLIHDYTDADFHAAELAKVEAAMNARVSNADVLRAVDALTVKVDAINEAVGYVVGIAEQVKDQAAPTIDAITSSPMFKMLLGGKGKKS